jgi:hypothetical protein
MVTFTATEGDPLPPPATVTVRLEYRGDTVQFGYAPEVSQPTWLSIVQDSSTVTSVSFKLQVTDTMTTGERSTTVRFVLSHESSTGLKTFDLQALYSVDPSDLAVQAAPTALRFAAPAGGPAPQSQVVSVTFNGPNTAVVAVPSWATASSSSDPSMSPASFIVSVIDTSFTPGTVLSDDIVFDTRRQDLQRRSLVHVTFNVTAFPPEVRFVAPYIGVAGRGGTLRVRGQGFQTGGPITVSIGTLEIGALTPDSDTQITLSYPALPEGRYRVTVSNPIASAPMQPELVIVAPSPPTYQAIAVTGTRTHLIHDAERQAIYGTNRHDEQIDHFVYADGTWSRIPSHVIPDLTDIAMTPNGRHLIALDRDTINEISLNDSLFTRVRRAENPEPLCGGFFDQAVPTNSEKIFIVFNLTECFSTTPAFVYDTLNFSLTSVGELVNGLAGGSADGTRIYAGSSGTRAPPFVDIFDSLSNSMSSSNVDFHLTAVSVSGDASRVILQNTHVYDRSLALTGKVPLHGVTLASRDSSRAFVYVDDAATPRIEVYDLNGPLEAGALYPLLGTVMLPDSANGNGSLHAPVAMTSSPDDAIVFVSGDSKLLVVPVAEPALAITSSARGVPREPSRSCPGSPPGAQPAHSAQNSRTTESSRSKSIGFCSTRVAPSGARLGADE